MGWINLYWEGEMVDDGKNVCVKKKTGGEIQEPAGIS